MTGYLGGTNHSALARSNERQTRQNRKCAEIDKRTTNLTFSGVVRFLRASEASGVYTAKLYPSVYNAAISMLCDVKADFINFRFGVMTVQFRAPKLPIWEPDEILMLPAPPKPEKKLRPYRQQFKIDELQQYGYTPLDLRISHLPKVFYFSETGQDLTKATRDELKAERSEKIRARHLTYSNLHPKAKQTPEADKLIQNEIIEQLFDERRAEQGINRKVQVTQAHERLNYIERKQALQALQATQANDSDHFPARTEEDTKKKLARFREMREQQPYDPELMGKAVLGVAGEQGQQRKRHNAIDTIIVGQAPSGTIVKRWNSGDLP